jgi:two-component system sensor histidine kinase BaeS
MVFFMSMVFTTIAVISTHELLVHAETYVQQTFSDHVIQSLSIYYSDFGSWHGVQSYVLKVTEPPDEEFGHPPRIPQRFLVFDQHNTVVASSSNKDLGRALAKYPMHNLIVKQWQPIQVNGKTVGYFWQDQHFIAMDGRLAKTIGTSIIQAMLIGLILTSLVALLLGLLLTRHFTEPLNRLMDAVRKVGSGDLSSRVEVKGKGDIAILAEDFNRMTEQLNRNEEVRRNMVADIAHELRTPLAVILGKLESIQEGVLPSTPETILPIHDETLRLTRLVRDLQQLSLAEAGKLPVAMQPVDLRALVERITEQFAIEFEERGLQVEVAGEVPKITGDQDRLTQVFVNLIGNALLHTPPGGRLRVLLEKVERSADDSLINSGSTHRLRDVFRRKGERSEDLNLRDEHSAGNVRWGEWVKVTVEDSGEGIPEEDLEHIFDRFYRVDKSRERENGGTGLGLAIANEFVQAQGGFVQVESKLGEGSRFQVFLPLKKQGGDEKDLTNS